MEDTITVIVEGKEIIISKKFAENSDLISGLMNLQQDKIELTNISADLFQTIVYLLDTNKTMHNLSKLYEYLGLHIKSPFLTNYCSFDNCTNMSFNGNNCNIHKCCYHKGDLICTNDPKKNGFYCCTHTCVILNCFGVKVGNSKLCIDHKCSVEDCTQRIYDEHYIFCGYHICSNKACPNMKVSNRNYCANHC